MSRMSFRRWMATSDQPLATCARRVRGAVRGISVPAPRIVVKPLLWAFLLLRRICFFLKRVFICEPLFKAYCEKCGKRLRTGVFVHWVQGHGSLIVGDHCWIDGKSTFTFASRYSDKPTLKIGDHSGIGHGCTFAVGKRITIGRHTLFSGQTTVFDSSGHHTDPEARRAGRPPPAEEVREVVIGDDVWIGLRCIIFPGVKIGDGSIVSAGSVVRTHVPPYSVVAGNPARVVFRLKPGQ